MVLPVVGFAFVLLGGFADLCCLFTSFCVVWVMWFVLAVCFCEFLVFPCVVC